ncbi:hypothetical protein E2562_009301 [Oryza meyeriana var. granulata]|uniref:Uncharacterized protein n=1 Tax=Oryza meyeriana var. granulata TaxID=110450 RepID=A0A6G1CGF2_9ORYZ|nr:hypothetical protein E2562_009301 [Oryza meyeriana var. granulata]
MARIARRSSSRLMRPSRSTSNRFSHSLNSSTVMSPSSDRVVVATVTFLIAIYLSVHRPSSSSLPRLALAPINQQWRCFSVAKLKTE